MRFLLSALLLLGTLSALSDDSLLRDAEQAFAQGRSDQAIELIDQYITASPKSPRGYLLRAAIRASDKQWAKSLPDYDRALELDPKLVTAYQRRAVARFMIGQIKESVADFDKFNEMNPDAAPQNWQRGSALYYAGRFEDGARQFELHRTVNPDDVENAAWHFCCVARWKTPAAAKAGLIPIEGDTRIPMAKIHEMFAGKAAPQDVIAVAKAGDPPPAQLNRQLFYAYLYSGLYCEAIGQNKEAKEYLATAMQHEVADYMFGVAKMHVERLNSTK